MGRPCAPSVGPIRAPRRVHSTPQTGTIVPVSGRPRSPGHRNWLVWDHGVPPAGARQLPGWAACRPRTRGDQNGPDATAGYRLAG